MGNFKEQPQENGYELPPVEPGIEEIVPDSDKRKKENNENVQDSIGEVDHFLDEMDDKNIKRDKHINPINKLQ